MKTTMPDLPAGGPGLLAQVATCIRTREGAETVRDDILRNGYEKDALLSLYRAILALLGDMAAITTLPEPHHSTAVTVYRKLKAQWIDESECRCIRTPTGGVARPMTTCPVHGTTPGARLGMRNFGGLKR